MLLLHGLGSSAEDWTAQLPALEPAYRVLLVDLPGHRRSALPRGRLTVERIAERVDGVLRGLEEAQVHVVGLSLGACVGMALALGAPGRVRSLTLINGFARLAPVDAAGALRMLMRLVLLSTAPMTTLAGVVAASMFPEPDQVHLREAAGRSLARTSRRGYLASVAALAAFDVRTQLGMIRCPTLVVTGLEDRTVARAAKEAVVQGIRGARSVLVPGSGHATPVDRADAFNRVLLEFLAVS